ncbi:MAG: hypothetical protein IT162_23205 [Bryobacterales bacterium]|nr:hypothetical protein [Bryobacterales bacterium]
MRRRDLLLAAAAAPPALPRLRVKERAGFARVHEPVSINVNGEEQIFFVTIGARQTKTFRLDQVTSREMLQIRQTDPVGFTVENSVFKADHSRQTYNGTEEDSGTLRALTYGNVTLRRTPNRMHWAPSFQRPGARAYTSIAQWTPVQKSSRRGGTAWQAFTREGRLADYPEIALRTEYRFFAHVPYFLFHAEATVTAALEMWWLRGQEMTMDDLFTHFIAPTGADGAPRLMTFEERKPILAAAPLPVDAWIAFVNLDKGYGFGAVPLAWSATTKVNPHLAIDDGARNGKYWDRHLISRTNTPLKPGDQFTERTAFVLFRPQPNAPAAEFLAWRDRLLNPLQVEAVR